MPKLAIFDAVPLLSPNPLPYLHEGMEGRDCSIISKGTGGMTLLLRRYDEEEGEYFVLRYTDRDIITFKKDGMILDLGPRPTPLTMKRANAILALYGLYLERHETDIIFLDRTRTSDKLYIRDQVNPNVLALYRREGKNLIYEGEERSPLRVWLCEPGGRGVPWEGKAIWIPYTTPEHTAEKTEQDAVSHA